MAKSDLSEIRSEAIRNAIFEIIEKRLKSKNFKITLCSASEEGESNFCGIIYRVLFNEVNDENDSKSSLILKLAPQNVSRRIQFHSRKMFSQEIYMYTEVNKYRIILYDSIKTF